MPKSATLASTFVLMIGTLNARCDEIRKSNAARADRLWRENLA